MLPLRAGPRRQVSGSPTDFYRVSRKGGLTWEGEHGSRGRVPEVGGEMVKEGPGEGARSVPSRDAFSRLPGAAGPLSSNPSVGRAPAPSRPYQAVLFPPEAPHRLFQQPALWPTLAALALLSSVAEGEASLGPAPRSPVPREGPTPASASPAGPLPGR